MESDLIKIPLNFGKPNSPQKGTKLTCCFGLLYMLTVLFTDQNFTVEEGSPVVPPYVIVIRHAIYIP